MAANGERFGLRLADVELPDPAVEFLVNLTNRIPSGEIRKFAQRKPELFANAPVSGGNNPLARQRLRSALKGSDCRTDAVWHFVLCFHPACRALSGLSTQAVEECLPALTVLLGEGAMISGLLLDQREAVRALGVKMVGDPAPHNMTMTPRAAATSLQDRLGPLFVAMADAFEELPVEVEGDPPSSPRDESTEESESASSKEAIPKKLRRIEQHLGEVRRDLGEREAENRDLKNQLKERAKQLHLAEAECAKLALELRDTRAAADVAVRAGIEEELGKTARAWLRTGPARHEATLDHIRRATDLVAEADALIARQIEHDLAFGTRHKLAENLVALRERQEGVEDALGHALNPLPELLEMRDQLAKRCQEIELTLGSPKGSAMVERLCHSIGPSGDPNELEQIRHIALEMRERGMLTGEEVEEFECLIDDKVDQLFDVAMASMAKGIPASSLRRSLRGIIRAAHPAVLVVDGHNLLNAAQSFLPAFRAEVSHALARDKLVEALSRFCERHSSLIVRLFFDGPHGKAATVSDRLTVSYSGGEGEHRADLVILGDLAYLRRANPGSTLLLCTDDVALAREAETAAAIGVTTSEMCALLRSWGCIGVDPEDSK